MTTISSTSGTTAPASNNATASASSSKPYDGKAAVAKAQALAQERLAAQDTSALNKKLTDLPTTIIDLLQGGSGTDAISTLFGGDSANALLNAQTKIALYGAAQKRGAEAAASSPVDGLIGRLIKANTSV